MTRDVLNKLEEVFALGGTDQEACFYANISHQALYNYQAKCPEFVERKEALKIAPNLKARRTIVDSLDKPQFAFEFAKKKLRKEFGDSIDITSKGKELKGTQVTNLTNEQLEQLATAGAGGVSEKGTSAA